MKKIIFSFIFLICLFVITTPAQAESFYVNTANSKHCFNYNISWDTLHNGDDCYIENFVINDEEPFAYTSYSNAYYLRRNEYAFSTDLPKRAKIISATFNFYHEVGNEANDDSASVILLDNTNNANLNHPIQGEDFNDFGTASIGQATFASLSGANGWRSIILTDLDVIKDGTTYIGVRTDLDINDTAPTGENLSGILSGTAGGDPYLDIVYEIATSTATTTLSDILDIVIAGAVSLSLFVLTNFWPFVLIIGIIVGLLIIFRKLFNIFR